MPLRLLWDQFLGSDAPPVVVHRMKRDHGYEAHDHDFFEIVFAVSGAGTHRSIYGAERIAPGSVYLLAPGVWHEYSHCRNFDYYDLYVEPGVLDHELAWLRLDPAFHCLLGNTAAQRERCLAGVKLSEERRGTCFAQLDELMSMALTRKAHRSAYIGRLLLLMNEMLQCARSEQNPLQQRDQIHPAVATGTRLLRNESGRDWTLTELAHTLHVAPEYLVRLFTAGTGLPPMSFLACCRCECAATLLLGTEKSIAEIAREVGWPDPNHFARRFRAHFNQSPSDYRKSLKGRAAET